MLFEKFSIYLAKLEKTSSRLEITAILAKLFDDTDQNEIKEVVYLSLGMLAPSYDGILLNLAEKMLVKSIALSYDQDQKVVNEMYKKEGDLGIVAEKLASKKIIDSLSVSDVYLKLFEISKDNGEGSQDRKIEKMASLFKSLDSLSVRYVARIPVGKLRLGFSEKTVIDALSNRDKDLQVKIEEAYNIRPDIGYIAELVKKNSLEDAIPEIGIPVVPMLAQRLNSTTEMIKKMGEVSIEPKFDGLRMFIHYRKKDNFLRIFTRNMNVIDVNTLPELLDIGKHLNVDEVILDSEAVGIDQEREIFLDFQKTIQRRRKHDIKKSASEIPLQFQIFDILLLNGDSLIKVPYRERRLKLEKAVINGSLLRVDEMTVTKDPDLIKKLHFKYLGLGLEGVVVKKIDSHYCSGRNGWNWVKMKELEGQEGRLSDTIDCIVMGYFVGKGKRAQFGLGKILVGIVDGDNIKTLTKIGTGLTEDMLVEIRKRVDKLESREKPKDYEAQKDLIPDVWSIPKLVVEVTADSISKSTKHSLGLSLRFPRFLRIREDKGIKDATTLEELKSISEN